jgi:hypothetical protein
MYILHACTQRRSSCRLVRVGFLRQATSHLNNRLVVIQRSYLILQAKHRTFRFSRVMRVPRCHVAPLYHVTSRVSTTRTNFARKRLGAFAFVHRWYYSCVCASNNPIIVIAVENGGPSHGESPLLALHARTNSGLVGRFQDQTKRERVCMTKTAETHDWVAHHARNQILRLER